MRILVLFNLKPGVDPADYERFARETDIPGVNGLSSVIDFTVHRATGLFGSDAPSPYQYAEVIDVTNLDHFIADVSTDAVQAVAARFAEFADDPKFILTEDL